jgi:NADPH-dependent 2,4-dienoyl-CoA reductase/sulfur reductase-like enzyme
LVSTASSIQTTTIVGGGLAGFTVARELRSRGFDGTLRIVDPQGLPYDRPPLSKAYLDGRTTPEALQLAPASWFADNAVEIVEDAAVGLAAGRGCVRLASGSELPSDAVVLATGGRARKLPIPGGRLPGVVTLRTRADAEILRRQLRPGARIAIVGAGLIGAEVASTAVKAGAHVTLIDPVPIPLIPAVGEELAETLHRMHAAHGVDVLVGTPTRISAARDALLVDLDAPAGPTSVATDIVLTAVGIDIDTTLADSIQLPVESGIEVDPGGATANPAVWAAGDGIRIRDANGLLGRRGEHWEAAIHSGTAVACGILGEPTPERPPAWFWTDRYGVHAEAVGSMSAPGRTVLRESTGHQRVAFRLDHDGTLVGCATIDSGKTLRAARQLIARGVRVDPVHLADPSVDLKKLARIAPEGTK